MTPVIKVNHRLTKRQRRQLYVEFWADMMPFVAEVVLDSFVDVGMRNPTTSAVRERVDLVKDLVDELRNGHGWSRQRIRHHLAYMLRAKLSGLVLPLDDLSARSVW